MNNKIKYRIIFLLMTVCITSNVLAQQEETEYQKYTYNNIYYIQDIDYMIIGLITEAALTLKLSLKKGINFNSQEKFLNFIYDKRTRLKNLRQLKSSSTIIFTSTWNKEKEHFDVILTIHAIADWTVFVLPYFKYSDNSGLLISGRGRDYNFLGSLETLRINLNYTFQNNLNKYEASTGFKYPIKINEHILTPGFEETISWRDDNLFENKTKFTLDYVYSLLSYLTFISGASQNFTVKGGNKSQPDIYSYAKSIFYAGTNISLNQSVLPIVNIFVYSPKIEVKLLYPLNKITPIRDNDYNDTFYSFIHDISFGRIDWVQNLRQGLSVSLGNKIEYQKSYNGYNIDVNFEAKGHFIINSIIGLKARVYFIKNFYYRPDHKNTLSNAGTSLSSRLRGVLDDKFGNAISGMALNTDILINLFSLQPLLIDEVQLGLFSDIALRQQYETSYDPENDIKVTTGFSLTIFSIYRSLHLRASLGIDILQAVKEEISIHSLLKNREFFIGLDLFY